MVLASCVALVSEADFPLGSCLLIPEEVRLFQPMEASIDNNYMGENDPETCVSRIGVIPLAVESDATPLGPCSSVPLGLRTRSHPPGTVTGNKNSKTTPGYGAEHNSLRGMSARLLTWNVLCVPLPPANSEPVDQFHNGSLAEHGWRSGPIGLGSLTANGCRVRQRVAPSHYTCTQKTPCDPMDPDNQARGPQIIRPFLLSHVRAVVWTCLHGEC